MAGQPPADVCSASCLRNYRGGGSVSGALALVGWGGAAGLGRTDAIGRDIRLAQLLIEAEVPIDAARLGDAGVKLKSLLKARPAATPEIGSGLGGAGALID